MFFKELFKSDGLYSMKRFSGLLCISYAVILTSLVFALSGDAIGLYMPVIVSFLSTGATLLGLGLGDKKKEPQIKEEKEGEK